MSAKRPRMLNEPPEPSLLNTFLSVLGTLCVIILLALSIFNLWLGTNYYIVQVQGDSMKDTFYDGDLLYTKREFTAVRGDVIIVNVENYHQAFREETERIIKRLIAVEGDCVKCEKGTVYLKEAGGEYKPLKEDYAKGRTFDFEEVRVGKGEIFFLGDNREHSNDSRYAGCLLYEDIEGVVPRWAIEIKSLSTQWEGLRNAFVTSVHE